LKKKLAKAVAKLKKAPKKKVAPKKTPASKSAKKSVKKAPAKKVPAKKAPEKKTPPKKVPPKKAPVKKQPAEIIKGQHKTALTSSTAKGATTISVYKPEVEASDVVVVEEKRLVLPPPIRKPKPGKKPASLKPIKAAPAPLVVSEGTENWSATELKSIRSELLAQAMTRLTQVQKLLSANMKCHLSTTRAIWSCKPNAH
jgi:hypothetical protein